MKRKFIFLLCSTLFSCGTLFAITPVAAFSQSATSTCVGTSVNFTDNSTGTPTSWAWTFPSGTPSSSTAQNPSGIIWNAAGNYTITLTVSNLSGSSSITHTITINGLPTISTSTTANTICSGSSVTITASGATTYNWMPGSLSGNPITVFPSVSTTYTVTGTNSNGCTNTATRPITVNPSPTVTATATSATICAGGSTTMTATGATTYNWMPGNHNGPSWTVSPAATTTYTVTGTTSGCSGVTTQLITVNPTPTVTTTTTGSTICAGSSTSITASGATTYAWMPGSLSGTTVTVSPAITTTYTVTGTSSGCSATATRTITVNPSPTVTTTTTAGTICSGNSTSMTASGATSYAWMPGSLSGATVTVSPAATTTYTVTGTGANGCTSTASRTITVNPTPTVTVTTTGSSICSGSSTDMTASGATTFSWMPGSLSGAAVTVSPAATTTYTVTGTSSGCSSATTQLITVNPTPTVTTTTTAGTICSGNSTSVSASGASTYTWMPGSLSGTTVTVSPATTTTYTLTGTSAAGCSATATRTITVNPSPTVTATATSATICAGSSTTMTATGASTYNWMPGNHNGANWTVSPAATTTYTVTGTASGCSGVTTQLITVNPTPTVTTTTTAATICAGSSTSITASGAATYSWMPGSLSGTTVAVSPAATTTYTVTGTSSGCSATATRTITVNPSPTVTTTTTAGTICSGNSTSMTASGATSYAWMPGSLSGATVTVSPAATITYTVTGTGANGCTSTASRTITVNPTPTVTVTTTGSSICSGSSTDMTASGATTYSWMPGSLSGAAVTVSPAATTTYSVTGTSSGCSSATTQLITVNPLPVLVVFSSSAVICAGSNDSISASGATSYNWMPGNLNMQSAVVAPVSSSTYTVTAMDVDGCVAIDSVSIIVNPLPIISAAASSTVICMNDSVVLSSTGATTYNWMPLNTNGSTITDYPISSTTYTVTGTDNNGCANSDSVSVTVNPLPVISISGDTLICIGNSANLGVSGAASYLWMPGNLSGNTIIVSPSAATSYSVSGTDANGCSNTGNVTVNVVTPPAVPSIIVNGNTLTSTVSGATYQWFLNGIPIAGATNQSCTALQSGTYSVEVYDAAGCGSGQSTGVDPTGILILHAVDFLNAYPNPTEGNFHLEFAASEPGNYILEIHNTLGQLIYSEKLANFSGEFNKDVDISTFSAGIYSIRISNGEKESAVKIIRY